MSSGGRLTQATPTGSNGVSYEVAFQANTGHLWTTGSNQHGDWGYGMMTGSNPSIVGTATGSNGIGYEVISTDAPFGVPLRRAFAARQQLP